MAEIFPVEGLDAILAVIPKNGANYSQLWMGLFTSQTASTVITRAQTLAGNITEPSGGAYARQSIASSSWGSQTDDTTVGRKVVAGQVTFPTATATWGTVNGFFIASASASGVCIFQANFDDVTAIVVNTNDVVKVTPTVSYLH